MNLKPLGANKTEIDTGKFQVLFSYQTPVAMHYSGDDTVYVTDKKWSNTTTRHINSWLAGNPVVIKPQEYFDNLMNEVK